MPDQTRTAAIQLTLHRLTASDPAAVYDEVVRLCKPAGVENLMALAIHLADAMAVMTERECGSREAAIKSLQQQLDETTAS
jgi:hypothetical protein